MSVFRSPSLRSDPYRLPRIMTRRPVVEWQKEDSRWQKKSKKIITRLRLGPVVNVPERQIDANTSGQL